MTQPASGAGSRLSHLLSAAGEQALQGRQRQSSAGVAISRAGDGNAGQVRHAVAGDITKQDLEQEHLDGGDGTQVSFAPTVACLSKGGADGFVVQLERPGALELANNLCHVGEHVRVSVEASVLEHSPFYGDSGSFASAGTAIAATLNHCRPMRCDYPDAIP